VNRLAKLAGLSLTDTEKQDLHTSIQTLINLVHPITTVHTAKDVEPLISLVADRNALILDAHSHGISETKQEKLRDQQDALITLTNEPFGHELLKQCHSKVDEFMYVVQQRG
jgi:Asp-tRNA(Asn)/Glu-tRNA(Gln) amidotransferase C subunit